MILLESPVTHAANITLPRLAIAKTQDVIRSKFPQTEAAAKAAAEPIPVYARNHSAHPLAYLKQTRNQSNRWFSTQARGFISSAIKPESGLRVDRSKHASSKIGSTIRQGGVSPFATTLRPNLTGGTLPRTAGGYSLGGAGKARHFSHTSGCQAQVVHNVSAGVRAFVVGGGKVRYDGVDPVTGEKRFNSVTATQEEAYKCFDRSAVSSKGTSIEFKISPTITALVPVSYQGQNTMTTLHTPELLSTLSGDFARSLRSLSLILKDLERLSEFGELPVSLADTPEGPVLIVRFMGCDADLVTRLCDEVGVMRGVIKEDEAWNEDKEVQMALLFPFAPTKSQDGDSPIDASDYFLRNDPLAEEVRQEQVNWQDEFSDCEYSLQSEPDDLVATLRSPGLHPRSPSGYESLGEPGQWTSSPCSAWKSQSGAPSTSRDFEGVEGIYRFIQMCDDARG